MRLSRLWRGTIAGSALAMILVPRPGFGFVEQTVTDGELPVDINGVWLVVSEIHQQPQATPTPNVAASPKASASGAAAAPSPQAAKSPAGAESSAQPAGVFSVLHLFKITHVKKADLEKIKEAEAKRQQAAVDKAMARIAAEQKAAVPAQTESGEVEGGPKVLVPTNDSIVPPPAGDEVDIALLDVAFPRAIQESLQKAVDSRVRFVPTEKDKALLRSSWSTLKPSGRDEYSKIDWKVVTAEHFDSGLKADEKVKGSVFAITADQKMIPRPGQPTNNIVVFGVRNASDKELSGGHVRAMMASAPFPIPIDMKGAFTMYKIADLPTSAAAAQPQPAKSPSAKAKKH